jgi:hypothetical protein
MLSRIKLFLDKLLSERYKSNSELKLIVNPTQNIDININNINILISPEGDVTIKGIRILDLNSEYTFLNCDNEEFKELAKDSDTFQAKYIERTKELKEKYDFKH